MLPAYMKQIDNTLYYSGPGEMIYYIPEKYFELKIATVNGEYIETLGVFCYCNFSESGKATGPVKPFKCPTAIKCKPSYIEKLNNFHLSGTKAPNS